VNFVGNTLLVPKLGCQGAAISTGISYIVFFALRTFFSNRYYYIDYALKRFSIITIIAIAYAWYNTFFNFNIISILGYAICILTLFILYKNECFEGFVIAKKQLIEIMKKRK
jgi:O-antigen/teichoic acid export membrane protein